MDALAAFAVGAELLSGLALAVGLTGALGLVATGVVVIVILLGVAAILDCALNADWRARFRQDVTTIGNYGSAAPAGAWALSGQATRFAWQHFPDLPPGSVCALGAVEGIATNSITNAIGGQRSSASDTTFAAAMGCTSGGSGGGENNTGGNTTRRSDGVKFDSNQLQQKFDKHGWQFGATSVQQFKQALVDFIDAPTTQEIRGTYRGTMAVDHFYDPTTKLWVAVDANGNFITGFKLSAAQEHYLLTSGNVQ